MIYYLAIAASIILFIFILRLVRNHKLYEKYSILWITFGTIILVVSLLSAININLIETLSIKLRYYVSTNTYITFRDSIFNILYFTFFCGIN